MLMVMMVSVVGGRLLGGGSVRERVLVGRGRRVQVQRALQECRAEASQVRALRPPPRRHRLQRRR